MFSFAYIYFTQWTVFWKAIKNTSFQRFEFLLIDFQFKATLDGHTNSNNKFVIAQQMQV